MIKNAVISREKTLTRASAACERHAERPAWICARFSRSVLMPMGARRPAPDRASVHVMGSPAFREAFALLSKHGLLDATQARGRGRQDLPERLRGTVCYMHFQDLIWRIQDACVSRLTSARKALMRDSRPRYLQQIDGGPDTLGCPREQRRQGTE